MASSLFGNSQNQRNNGNMLQRFAEFKKNITPQKAQEQVMELLKSGKMSKTQFENLKFLAQKFGS